MISIFIFRLMTFTFRLMIMKNNRLLLLFFLAESAEHDYPMEFFAFLKEGSRRSARQIVPMVVDLVEPKSVVDVGCGTGEWLTVFRENGVREILGIDHAIESEVLELSKSEFMDFDLRLPLKLCQKFDLVVSLEVAEHLPKEFAEVFVDSLVALGDVVLFSAAIPQQQGFGHVNEQWPDNWARIFASKGFLPVDCLRTKIWTNDDVEPWYAQNILLYATQFFLDRHPRLREQWEANRGRPLAIVHPRVYEAALGDQELFSLKPMFKCAACGGLIRSNVKFCPLCGAAQPDYKEVDAER
jgi:SAM-dependent methyltransferase